MARAPKSKNARPSASSTATEAETRRLATGTLTIDRPVEAKDATELKLEKLLFGDDGGFMDNVVEQNQELALADNDVSDEYEQDEMDETAEDDGQDLGGLRDDDLFMVDTGADVGAPQQLMLTSTVSPGDGAESQLAWEDSDDERLTISLASRSQLRKLRYTEGEDVVTGKEYARRLREQYERLHPTPDWANPKSHRKKRRRVSENLGHEGSEVSISDEDMSDDESVSAQPLAELLQSAQSLVFKAQDDSTGKSHPLPTGNIDVQRLRDVSSSQPSAIASLSFHPSVSPPLLLSSGPSGLLSMHHISSTSTSSTNPTNNLLLTSLAIPRLAIETSIFHPSGSRIFFAGRRRYFHVWDLPSGEVSRVTRITGNQDTQKSCEQFRLSPCGRYMALVGTAKKGGGVANILDATTGQWIAQARVEGRLGVTDLAWWADGEGLTILAKSGEVVEYSVSEKRVVARWRDEGAVGSTVLALGGRLPGQPNQKPSLGPDRWVAVGSQSGIVNIYDRVQWSRDKLSETPKPRKMLPQLTTPTSHLQFSPDGQLLVLASRWKKDALRLVHLPSCSVYKNWPTSNSPLGRVTSVAWATNSRLLAVGNEAGKIRLWEIRG